MTPKVKSCWTSSPVYDEEVTFRGSAHHDALVAVETLPGAFVFATKPFQNIFEIALSGRANVCFARWVT